MNPSLRLFLAIAVLVYFVAIFVLLKKERLILKYTLLWILSGIVMILVIAFPGGLKTLAHAVGIIEPTNGVFALALFGLLLLSMALTSIVSTLNAKIRRLVQVSALYEKRIRELETRLAAYDATAKQGEDR